MSKIVGGDECIGDDVHGRRDRVLILIDIHDDDVVAVGGRAAVATAAVAAATVRMDKIRNDIVDAAVNDQLPHEGI